MTAPTVDTVLDKLSRCHVVIFVFAFIRGLPVTWNLMMPVFVAPSAVDFRCNNDALNHTVDTFSGSDHHVWTNNTAQCFRSAATNGSEPCESWIYDRSVYGKTVTEEFNMVCGNRWMVSSSQSLYLAGMVVGTVAASHTSDWFGRKKTILGGILLSVAASAMTALSTSVTMYYVSRFVVALGVAGYADVIYTLIMETVSPRFRYMPTMTMGNGWTTGMLLLPWLHYLTKEWRATQLYATLPLAPLFLLGWIISSIVWYHMTVSTAAAGGNPYVSFTIGASSEYPVKLINVVLIKYCRRRYTICGTMCFSALVMVALWLVPAEYSWLRLGLLMLGKVGTSVNGAVLRVQLSETYPTVVRSVAMGFCYTLGRLGSALAPFFDDLGEATQSWVPSIVSAGLCLAGAGASWLLPESFEKTLEDGFSKHEATENKVAVTGNTEPQQIYVLEMTHF
ncbi:organic cation transporter protein isoform X2 [Rhipicephalus microplus]|uniref:organic cation transporter protein isoform X2 n=1 Tax=Rhipicephalus microplus TaxID=6941 RepID=UPI003F6B4DEE